MNEQGWKGHCLLNQSTTKSFLTFTRRQKLNNTNMNLKDLFTIHYPIPLTAMDIVTLTLCLPRKNNILHISNIFHGGPIFQQKK